MDTISHYHIKNSFKMLTSGVTAVSGKWASLRGYPCGSAGKESSSTGDIGDISLIPGSGIYPNVGNGNPFQYSCLENSMGREAWQAIVHGVAKSWIQLSE